MTAFYATLVVAAWLFLLGVYGMVTSRNLIHLCLCLVVVQSSTYLLLTATGYRKGAEAPIFADIKESEPTVDPVVQALMLTDIVVEATVVALLLAITVKINQRTGNLDPNQVNLMRG